MVRAELLRLEHKWESTGGAGLAYNGPASFVLEHGQWCNRRLFPFVEGFEQGAPRACFGSAIALAVMRGVRYFEGYALDPMGGIVPHGWNADADGRLIDATWVNTGFAYVGVEFSVERADDASWNGDAHVLGDAQRGWPILQQRWKGEPAEPAEYEGTAERLAILRSGNARAWENYLLRQGVRV